MDATNKQVVLRRVVAGRPTLDDLELVEGPVPEPQAGEVLVRTIYLSLDPYMRGRMSTPEAVGEVMVGGVVGEVVVSNAAGVASGQLVCQYVGGYGWQRLRRGRRVATPRPGPGPGADYDRPGRGRHARRHRLLRSAGSRQAGRR